MNWINIKRADWIALECTNPFMGIYVVRFSPTTSIEQTNEESQEDARVIPIRYPNSPSIDEIKADAINNQEEYDNSHEVNHFTYNGEQYWFSKDERVALLNSFNIIKEQGKTDVTLWLDRIKIVINVDVAIAFIHALEIYAVACNNTKREHINQISSLNTIEDVAAFDITADYPNQLELTI